MTPQLLLLVGAGGGLTLLVLLATFWGDRGGSSYTKRLARVSGAPVMKIEKSANPQSLRRRTSDSNFPLLDRLIKSTLPNPEKLRARLGRTGRNISVGEYLIVNAVLVLLFYLIFAYGLHWSRVMAFFMGIAVGLYLPHMVTGRMGNRRIRKFLGSFPEAIDTICRGLRSGLPITESIATVGNELPDPVGIEFRRISDGVRMGRSLDEAMWEVSGRLDTPEYRFFIIALAIQKETGGNLAETLGNLADLLRKRRQLKLKIRAMSSEARASAMIIGSLPFLMFGLLMAVNSEYMMILLNDTRGKMIMAGGLTWLSLGVFFMKQMINFEI
ncbi:MAG: type II secretion system F family protein [Alphaproteobacteria bacterium]|nr:type II secretion system F family protein [Alphaproteobacteria bacterium]